MQKLKLGTGFIVAALGLGFVLWQWHVHARLEDDLAALRRPNQGLVLATATPTSEPAQSTREAEVAAATPVRAEVTTLEKQIEAAAHPDPAQGMVPLAQLHNAGRATAAKAFQTLTWAAFTGADEELGASLAINPATRPQWDERVAMLSPELRAKIGTPEKLAGQFLAEEILRKIVSIQVMGETNANPDRTTLQVRATDFNERARTQGFPMEMVAGEWRLTVPDDMAQAVERKLNREAAKAPKIPR